MLRAVVLVNESLVNLGQCEAVLTTITGSHSARCGFNYNGTMFVSGMVFMNCEQIDLARLEERLPRVHDPEVATLQHVELKPDVFSVWRHLLQLAEIHFPPRH